MKELFIDTEFIRIDQLLKYANIVGSGGEAKVIIKEGLIKVNGEIVLQRGKKIRHGDVVEFDNMKLKVLKKS